MRSISLIVPCYNASAFLSATVESILRQDFRDWELILVDDGSSDNTGDIINRYVAFDPRISGFRKSNEGTTKARNYGFSKADTSSRYVWFLDHDDQLEPNALSHMCTYMDAHPEVGLLACQYQDISADGRKLGTGKRSRWAPGPIFPHEMRDDEGDTPFVSFFCATGQGPFALYRRSVYLQTEGWENSFWPHEDTDMFCQMALLGTVHFLPDRLYLKRIHPAQGMNQGGVQRAYFLFRAKWDNRKPRNEREAVLLQEAKRYYYSMHRPCRDLKTARKAFLEVLLHRRLASLRWGVTLVVSALRGLLFGRIRRGNR